MKRCELCGTVHESYQAHVFATNTDESATNSRTANRRTREAYNAYQRQYMKKRRENKKEK